MSILYRVGWVTLILWPYGLAMWAVLKLGGIL